MADQILKKLEEHDERFDKLDERLDRHDKRFDEHDKKFDRIIKAVVENKERLDKVDQKLENVATKDDVSNMMSTLDEIVGLHKKTEQEQVFMGAQVKRNTTDIEKIKPLVGLETS